MARTFFKSAWGSVELWIAKISTNKGRDLVIQKYTSGNVPDVQNRGAETQLARCQLLFDDITGQKEPGVERLQSLIRLASLGKPQLFTHPLEGTYLAEIQGFDYEIDESGTFTGSATFVATEEIGAVLVDPIGVSFDVDASGLDAQIDALQAELDAVGVDSDIPGAATAASSLFDQAQSARETLVGLSDISERIGQEINDLELAADIELWPLFKAFVLLDEATRLAAVAATGDVGALMTVRVDQEISLRRLMAEIYGAQDAESAGAEAMQLNDIPTPARIPRGMQLKIRQPNKPGRANASAA